MKVFLSWSGDLSHKVACALRDWLPNVLQFVEPYVSSEDIDKGARWSTDIAGELDASAYGILCITQANLNAPWITFEAGALSKTLEKARVSPLLFNIKRSEIQGPILQFQSTIAEQDDIFKLIASVNRNASETETLDDERLRKVFDVWWPELQKQLEALPTENDKAEVKTKSKAPDNAILEELLDLVRSQQKILNDPESLLPRRYIEHVLEMSDAPRLSRHRSSGIRDLQSPMEFLDNRFDELDVTLKTILKKARPTISKKEQEEIGDLLTRLRDVIKHMKMEIRHAVV